VEGQVKVVVHEIYLDRKVQVGRTCLIDIIWTEFHYVIAFKTPIYHDHKETGCDNREPDEGPSLVRKFAQYI
jgi:hypothetical protein